MKFFIQKLLKKVSLVCDDLNSENQTNYKDLNKYLLQINQQKSIEEMVSETSDYLKSIFNYKLFVLAIKEKTNHIIWSDPVLSKKTVKEIVEQDFPNPNLFTINYNKNKKVITTLFTKPDSLESYEFKTSDLHIKLYLKRNNTNSEMESETAGIIIQAFGTALMNMLKIKELEAEASTDHLTGCYNRRSFTSLITHNIENSHRYKRDLSIILLDIDNFKRINDTYGHQAGDEVLKAVSNATQAFIRKGDYLSRYGGEEFIAVLPETAHSVAIEIAYRLKTEIENLLIKTTESQTIRVTASYGVAALKPGYNIDSLIAEADSMLYKAKSNGRNCVMPKLALFDQKTDSNFAS